MSVRIKTVSHIENDKGEDKMVSHIENNKNEDKDKDKDERFTK